MCACESLKESEMKAQEGSPRSLSVKWDPGYLPCLPHRGVERINKIMNINLL